MIKKFLTSIFICLSLSTGAFGGQEFFPFVGEVTAQKANIRTGQSQNFEVAFQISQGDELVVLERNFSWLKVRLPKSAKSYVSSKYIQRLGDDIGGVTGDRVNIRIGPDVNKSVIGQVVSGEEVRIIEVLEDWYGIEPTDNTYGWISEDLIAFKSRDVESFQRRVAAAKQAETKKESEVVVEDGGIVTVSGVVELRVDPVSLNERYVLTVDRQPMYTLEGVNHVVSEFLHYKVSVEGALETDLQDKPFPALKVSKIELIL